LNNTSTIAAAVLVLPLPVAITNNALLLLVVPLQLSEQFNRLNELESIVKDLCNSYDANFGFFGTCSLEKDNVIYLLLQEYQLEKLK
jgi:hypothetical protein